MASNPMQRKTRNSFLLGMLVMLLIAGVVIAFLFMQLMNKIKEEQEELKASVNAYVLNQDVKSGQVITTDMLTLQVVNKNLVPNNATSDISVIENYALQDKEGNEIITETKTVDNKTVSTLYITINNKKYEMKKEDITDNYYIEKDEEKQYIELNTVPLIAKVDMKKNTVITTELLNKSDSIVQDDVRKQEYNMLVLPTDLETGDYVDVRVMFPSGQDFIVVAKKEVEIPNIAGVDSEDTVWMNLTEDETLHMSCAIIDSYQVPGSKIYVTKYTEAGMQENAIPTFPVNGSTSQLLQKDPNILEKAMAGIVQRYNATGASELRENINNIIEAEGEQAKDNLEANMKESIKNAQDTRKEYLESLAVPVQ